MSLTQSADVDGLAEGPFCGAASQAPIILAPQRQIDGSRRGRGAIPWTGDVNYYDQEEFTCVSPWDRIR